ncbi:hypothetical protein [Chryseolinea lacunae]|uniref:Polyketide cyclase n=1 Tax=Chryseolinea lacunae TaxID=2801331 RepID=A0ABS1KZ51_9BACT|nr:hypothetical protein [Chryseolinea lacunae]MBL0744730.1 hypothetical protein [Chryseolinea lacunae]
MPSTLIVTDFVLPAAVVKNAGAPRAVVKSLMAYTPWVVDAVTVDGVDQTALYGDFRLMFSDEKFLSSGGGDVWPARGTWCFADASRQTLQRHDGVVVHIDEMTPAALMLSLRWHKTTFAMGRLHSLQGLHTFSLIR